MESITLSQNSGIIKNKISLGGSKSESNRLLIISALSKNKVIINRLSDSDDSTILHELLVNWEEKSTFHCGHAGTTFRFLTSFLAMFTQKEVLLTGTKQLQKRPIGTLVDELVKLGAQISYEDKNGYPPLRISTGNLVKNASIEIEGNISSQFISSLLLIGPYFQNGFNMKIKNEVTSRPYIEMTLKLMESAGAKTIMDENSILVQPVPYQEAKLTVGADWSSASYLYANVALAKAGELKIEGLFLSNLQGDQAIAEIMKKFGVLTTAYDNGVILTKQPNFEQPDFLEYDFKACPDLAPTVVVLCAALNVSGLFKGLETLKIKECNRVDALRDELVKVGCFFNQMPTKYSQKGDIYYMLEGEVKIDNPTFETYEDHRMAMCFSLFANLGSVTINEPRVVSKSYPKYWEDMQALGFKIN